MKRLVANTWWLVGLVFLFELSGCRQPKSSGAITQHSESEAKAGETRIVAPIDDGREKDSARSNPADGAGIIVVAKGTTHDLTLSFCYFGDASHDPQISRVVLARVGSKRELWCELSAIGHAWLWREWRVGSAPDGFEVRNCSTFAPGEYEVFVDAFVGNGSLRLRIDKNGSVEAIPWDKLSGSPLRCPPITRTKPQTIPH